MYMQGNAGKEPMITTNALPAASGTGRVITLWTLSGLVALAFVGVGGGKLAGTAKP